MDWANEKYVRLYVRDTVTWKMLSWQSRLLMPALLRKMDRSGVLDIGDYGEAGIAAAAEVPFEFVQAGLPDLLRLHVFVIGERSLVMPNYIAAQETRQSDAQRQRDSRERRAATSAKPSPPVTPQCHQPSPAVTDGHSSPSLAVPSRTKKEIDLSDGFKAFWKVYPRKVAKQLAVKAWPGDGHLPAILAALDWQKATWTEAKFTPHPATWLNGKRWEDEKPTGPDGFRWPQAQAT